MNVTPIYAGVLALLYLVLVYRVVRMRGPGGPSLGDGGDAILLRRIRAHGNFSEYVPFILLMMAMLEFEHFPPIYLHAIGVTLVIARLLHGYALSFTQYFGFGRFWGAALTFAVLAVCGLLCLCLAFCRFW